MDVGVRERADGVSDDVLYGFGGFRGRGMRRGHAGSIALSPWQMNVRNFVRGRKLPSYPLLAFIHRSPRIKIPIDNHQI